MRRLLTRITPTALALGTVVALLFGTAAIAQDFVVNMTYPGASTEHEGAWIIQGGAGAGTGNWDPFLTISANTPTEWGYNTEPKSNGEGDTFFGGGRTHTLLASAVPSIEYDGGLYREFGLDANDQGSDTWMSIDELEVWIVPGNGEVTGYVPNIGFSNVEGEYEIYDIDENTDTAILMLSQGLESGSGVSDVSLLVPDSEFPCAYGDLECGYSVVLYTSYGAAEFDSGEWTVGDGDGGDLDAADVDWDVSAGFEEWRTELLPVVNVQKSVDLSFTRTYEWEIEKSVTPDSWGLFSGESGTSQYTVSVDRTGYTDSAWMASGVVTVTNPTGGAVIEKAIEAEILSVEDVVTQGTVDTGATVDCGVEFPYTLGAGDVLVCSYSTPLASGAAGDNVASATISVPNGTRTYDAEQPLDWENAAVTEVYDEINVTDTFDGAGPWMASDDASWSYTRTFACDADEGNHSNTAEITETGQQASASVGVNCYDLDVSKDAETSFTRTYEWTIDKSVTPNNWALFSGESGTSQYTVSVDKTGFVDSDWAVKGSITINNNHPDRDAELNSVTDLVSPDIAASVDCPSLLVPAGGQLVCDYSAGLPDASERTNTATATQQLFDFDFDLSPTADGTKDYSGSATVDVSDAAASITEVNAEINVTDTFGGAGPWMASDDASWSYTRTFACDADEGNHSNTAEITETGQQASASVGVDCYDLDVSKDAETSFTRTYEWTIDKSVTPDSWALFSGESGTSQYTVSVDKTGYTDSDWAVKGSITIDNNHPDRDADLVAVSDSISGVGSASVDCGGATSVPAGGQLVCDYGAGLPDASERTNTATATQQLYDFDFNLNPTADGTKDYSGSATVDVSDAAASITEVNAEINVTDTFDGAGPWMASNDASWSYTRTFTCDADEGNYDNTAKITETGQQASASVGVDCYDLDVSKDAETSLTRTYDWTIDKSADQTEITLLRGTTALVNYSIVVDASYTDSDWAVEGSITIENNHPSRNAELNSVADVVSSDIAASVECSSLVVPAGGQLVCSYSASLPDASGRTNTATATQQLYNFDYEMSETAAGTKNYVGSTSFDFSEAEISYVDEEIVVTDDYGTPGDISDDVNLGTVNALDDTLPKTLTYNRTFGTDDFPACGDHEVINTAKFVTNDTGTFDVDSWTIIFHIPCDEGLTPGYWKNHLENWVDYTPEQTVESVFDVPDDYGLDDDTLLEALNYEGGASLAGKAQILLRAAVAAVLNAAHPGVDYPISDPADVIAEVNDALASHDQEIILDLADELDMYNNLGVDDISF